MSEIENDLLDEIVDAKVSALRTLRNLKVKKIASDPTDCVMNATVAAILVSRKKTPGVAAIRISMRSLHALKTVPEKLLETLAATVALVRNRGPATVTRSRLWRTSDWPKEWV
jgi:hypothetical protein